MATTADIKGPEMERQGRLFQVITTPTTHARRLRGDLIYSISSFGCEVAVACAISNVFEVLLVAVGKVMGSSAAMAACGRVTRNTCAFAWLDSKFQAGLEATGFYGGCPPQTF